MSHGATTAVGFWLQHFNVFNIFYKDTKKFQLRRDLLQHLYLFQDCFQYSCILKLLQRLWDFGTAGSTVVVEVLSFWWILVLCPVGTGKAVWRIGAEFATGPEHSTQLWQVCLLAIVERSKLHFLILLRNQTTLTTTYVLKGVSKNYSKSKQRWEIPTVSLFKQKT